MKHALLLAAILSTGLSAAPISGEYRYDDNNLSGATITHILTLNNGTYAISASYFGLSGQPSFPSPVVYLAGQFNSSAALVVSVQLPSGFALTSADGNTTYYVSGSGSISFTYAATGGTFSATKTPMAPPLAPADVCISAPNTDQSICNYSLSNAQLTLTQGMINIPLATTLGGPVTGSWNEVFTASGTYNGTRTHFNETGGEINMVFSGTSSAPTSGVPEPATTATMLAGLALLAVRVVTVSKRK